MGPLAAAIGLGTSALGAVLGRKDAKDAEREQRKYIGLSLDANEDGLGELRAGQEAATPYLNDLLGLAMSMETDLMGQVDPVTASEMRRIRQEREMAEANIAQQMTMRGLDSFTTRMGQQSNLRGQAQNAISELGARMAAQRMSAMATGRGAAINALSQRAGIEASFGEARASNFAQRAQILSGVQVQAPNTAAGVGALGASLLKFGGSSVLADAFRKAGPGGGFGMSKELLEG